MSRHLKLTRKFAGFPMFKLATSGETFPITSPFTTGFTGLANDQLALDLQFSLDRSFSKPSTLLPSETQITSRIGPSPIFTRASSAGVIDSNGFVRAAPENIILQSENLATTWTGANRTVITNAAIAPNGTMTADKMVETTATGLHRVNQSVTTQNATTYTASVYLKAAGRSFAVIYSGAGPANGRYVSIPEDGTGTVLGLFGPNPSTVTMEYVGDGWYRVAILIPVSGASSSFEIYSAITGTNTNYTGDGSSGLLIWGAQVERHPSARAYIPTTTSQVYGPRFDHDPTSLVSKGLLMEETKTNIITYSEDFATFWQANASSISSNVTVSPSNLTIADRLNEDSTNAVHQVIQQVPALNAAAPYTFSVFAKAETHTSFQVAFSNTAFGSGFFVNFILSGSGLIGSFSGVTAKIEVYPNGWYRCVATINSVTGGANGIIHIAANNNNNEAIRLPAYLGTNAQVVNLWGAQLEQSTFPSSYIYTHNGTVARSADVCSITGGAFSGVFNLSQGTLFVNSTRLRPSGTDYSAIFVANDGTAANRITINNGGNPNDVEFGISRLGVSEYNGNVNTATLVRRAALAYSPTSTNRAYNGALGTEDVSSLIPTVTQFAFGVGQIITAVRYYQKRLPNAKLQAITV